LTDYRAKVKTCETEKEEAVENSCDADAVSKSKL